MSYGRYDIWTGDMKDEGPWLRWRYRIIGGYLPYTKKNSAYQGTMCMIIIRLGIIYYSHSADMTVGENGRCSVEAER